ncbi:MAG: hypothetical protein A2X49_08080 [Lentisphaerae bacterium GWF2_52_8]|nr:MAG: hypothetical protein A2X49_08080 [Lentisphaerae bacterium GWF2_52_8]
MGKILIYKGLYQYDAVNVFADELAEGLRLFGRTVVTVNLTDHESATAALRRELAEPCELVLSFGGVGWDLKSGNDLLHNALPYPFATILVDHPLYHINRLVIKRMKASCFDRSHLCFLRRHKPDLDSFLLAHGGCSAEDEPMPFEKRDISILCPCSYIDSEPPLQRIKKQPPQIEKCLLAAAEILFSTHGLPVEHAFEKAVRETNLSTEDPLLEGNRYYDYLGLLDVLHRARKRLGILNALDKAGIPVVICGNSWPKGLFTHHEFIGPKNFREVLSLMTRSRCVLNMALVPDGSHERVFSAMLNGALALSESNPFYEQHFTDGRHILFYRWTELDLLPERISSFLSKPDAMAKIAHTGQRRAAEHHTWKQRAGTLLSVLTKG